MKSNCLTILLSLLIISLNVSAAVSGFKVGARFYSIWENRGVIQYHDFQLLPIVALFMYEDRLEIVPSYISYRDYIYSDRIRFRTRLQTVNDNPVFPKHDSIKDIYPDRESTYEWVNRLEFFIPAYNENYIAEIDLAIHKDLKAHHGLYTELMGKLKLFTFENTFLKESTVEPNLYFSLGHGDKRHNEYFYGATNSDGVNNLAYGLWFNFLDLADRNNPALIIKHFEVLGDKNKNAPLARNHNKGWAAVFTYTHDFLK